MVKSVRETSQCLCVHQRLRTNPVCLYLSLQEFLHTLLAQTVVCFLCVGVLLCRGNRLLTGSNSKKLKLWSVTAVQNLRPSNSEMSSKRW